MARLRLEHRQHALHEGGEGEAAKAAAESIGSEANSAGLPAATAALGSAAGWRMAFIIRLNRRTDMQLSMEMPARVGDTHAGVTGTRRSRPSARATPPTPPT